MKLFSAAILAATLATAAGSAHAGAISISLSESGYSTFTSTGPSAAAGFIGQNYGTFTLNNVSAQGITAPGSLFSNAIDLSTASANTLTVSVTLSGVTAPLTSSNYLSSFTSNSLPAGWTVKELTYYSPTNSIFDPLHPNGTLLASTLFTHIGTSTSVNSALVGTGPYSLTEVYMITSTGSGTSNNTINLTAVPEPSTVVLFGMGLLGIGLVRKRLSANS